MRETIAVPVWIVVLFMVLLIAQQWIAERQSNNLRALFSIYLKRSHGESCECDICNSRFGAARAEDRTT